jgi:PadR family transcriptional regulator, regulatory protein PadR
MPRETLGDLEHQVLLALLRVGPDAYSVPVLLELEARTGREVAAAGVYIALRRLEEKGLVLSDMRAPEEGEGGRHRRFFRITPDGLTRLRDMRSALQSLWEGMEPRLEAEQ